MENKSNFTALSLQLETLKTELKEIKSDVSDLTLSVGSLDKDVRNIKEEDIPSLRAELKEEINSLKAQRVAAELYSKRSNLLFYGITQTPNEVCEDVIKRFIKDELHLDVNNMLLANTHRLPTRTVSTRDRPRPLIVKFVMMRDRDNVLSAAPHLRRSPDRFGISPHLPAVMQQARQKLLPIRREAIAAGKKAYIKTTGTDIKLYINDQLYKIK